MLAKKIYKKSRSDSTKIKTQRKITINSVGFWLS